MTQEEAFLQSIIDAPDDDAPRLIFADWLDDHGDPDRAAFIRVQCELAKLPDYDPRRSSLEAKEQELLKEHEEEWAGLLRRFLGGKVAEVKFRRGFVESAAVDVRGLLDNSDVLFRLAPIRHLTLYVGRYPPQPYRDRSVDFFAEHFVGRWVGQLAELPQLAHLATLSLYAIGVGDEGVGALAASRSLSGLRRLNLGENSVRDSGALALAKSSSLAGLVSLELGGNPIGRVGRAALRARFGDRVIL